MKCDGTYTFRKDTTMKVYKAPEKYELGILDQAIFLAGSIEMGKAEDWQSKVTKALEDTEYTILNPRRDDWDSSWKQDISNPQFYEQVTWELEALDMADVIIMHFVPDTMSPISLLELGLHANSGKLLVSCPEGFWRRGNVEIVCETYGIPFFSSIDELINSLFLYNRLDKNLGI